MDQPTTAKPYFSQMARAAGERKKASSRGAAGDLEDAVKAAG
jgi:hypothetical protein